MKIIDENNRNRSDLARMFAECGFVVGAEIGVDQGLYSEEICKNNPHVKLYCIDPWKSYQEYKDIQDQKTLDSNFEVTHIRLAPYDCRVIRATSKEAAVNFAPGSLDFVYIDGNHEYEYIKEDLALWAPKVRKGGIVSGHDYNKNHPGVVRAVNEHVAGTLYLLSKRGSSSWYYVQ